MSILAIGHCRRSLEVEIRSVYWGPVNALMVAKLRSPAPAIWSRVILLVVVGVLYVAACATPAVNYKAPESRDFGDITSYGTYYGIMAFLLGPIGNAFVWSANIWLIVGSILLLVRVNRASAVFAVATAAIGLGWAILDESMTPLLGGWLWVASLVVFALGAVAITVREARAKNVPATADTIISSR